MGPFQLSFVHSMSQIQIRIFPQFRLVNQLPSGSTRPSLLTGQSAIRNWSGPNVMREATFKAIGSPALKSTSLMLSGFGKNLVKPISYFETEIDKFVFPVRVYSVSDDVLDVDFVVGEGVIEHLKLTHEIKKIRTSRKRLS